MEAIESLTLKVDDVAKKHHSLTQFVSDDSETSKGILRLKSAENVLEVAESSPLLEWFYDEDEEIGILHCLPCFRLHLLSKLTLANLKPREAQRLLSSSSGGTLATGILMKKETNGIEDKHLSLPVTWDAAHVLNLAILDVKDADTASGAHFKRFIKRCNVFNTILANGKGFAFLNIIDSSARRPVSYACQRFTSSSFEQWVKVEKSFASFWQAFNLFYPNRNVDEQYQYMIAGSDFMADLLAFLDTLQPVVDLMLQVQSLDVPIWKLKLWWPGVRAKMEKASSEYPTSLPGLYKVRESLEPGSTYDGVTLLSGWLVTNTEGKGTDRTYTWMCREDEDVEQDHVQFAKDLLSAVENRVTSVTSDTFLKVLEIFDAQSLVRLQTGKKVGQEVRYHISDGEYDEYGVNQCKEVINRTHMALFSINISLMQL